MKIAIDARCLNVPHLRGMGKYLFNLLEHFANLSDYKFTLFGNRPDWPFFMPKVCSKPNFNSSIVDITGFRFRLWEQFALPYWAKRNDFTIIHFPGTSASFCQPIPTIVTIHDVLPWRDKTQTTSLDNFFFRLIYPFAYKRCAAIITISDASKRDIIKLWPQLESKVFVIPHGIDESYITVTNVSLPDSVRKIGVKKPYFLYFGGAIPRKRFDWALRIFPNLDLDVNLLACGVEKEFHDKFRKLLPPEKRKKLFFAEYIPEKDMPAIYYNCVATLYPTLYEGFGLPVLESQAVGRPVLFSAVGSLSELVGPAAIVLPLDDLNAWVEACTSLLSQWQRDSKPNIDARKWARQFNWEKSAKKHLAVYNYVLRKSEIKHKRGIGSSPFHR